ncbi:MULTISPECIES: hypothetical protein [unclassified Neisseria]|uniref:hypothetical protein n=1 Tax=unclassified Neisseria TaxID=2623750 RepID=UPI00107173F3|nr:MULTISPECIES: hypothetical protein [unclassified Neisseria]
MVEIMIPNLICRYSKFRAALEHCPVKNHGLLRSQSYRPVINPADKLPNRQYGNAAAAIKAEIIARITTGSVGLLQYGTAQTRPFSGKPMMPTALPYTAALPGKPCATHFHFPAIPKLLKTSENI